MDKLSSMANASTSTLSIPKPKIPEICAPVLIYFVFSIIVLLTSIVLMILGMGEGSIGTQIMNFFIYILLVFMFCLFLYKLCKLEYKKAAWFLALLPFLFIFVRFLLFFMVTFSPPPA